MTENFYDTGIMVSILFLTSIYLTTLMLVSYTTITRLLFKCKTWIFIPKFITDYFECVWTSSFDKKKSEVFLLFIILSIAIVPLSLVWPGTYIMLAYLVIKCKFDKLKTITQ